MGEFVRSAAFVGTLRENVSRYFGVPVEQQFSSIETRLVDLETGEYVTDVDPQSFDAEAAANDPKLGIGIPKEQDIAKLGRRAVYAPVHQILFSVSSLLVK